MRYKPVILIVLDGWGVGRSTRANAIERAKTPVTDSLTASFPHGVLSSMGGSVGLPWEEVGNSEVGHLAMGTGRVIYQDLMRVNNAIEGDTLASRPAIQETFAYIKKNNSNLHILGIVSDGGVHGHIDHLKAFLNIAQQAGVPQLYFHLILDGRDTERDSGISFVETLEEEIERLQFGKIASVIGRWWAMDRDNHWLRIQKSYDLMVSGQAEQKMPADELKSFLQSSYSAGIYDEKMPSILITKNDAPVATLKDNDALIFANFRPDRARQITKALTLPTFTKFDRKNHPKGLFVTTMTAYDESLPVQVIFSQEKIDNSLSKLISEAGLRQLHIGETEKYAHVTYFFDGYKENPYKGEEYALVKSTGENYDDNPAMGAYTITNKVERAISQNKYDFILVNYANVDMVGHTGNFQATMKAVEIVDECVGRLVKIALSINGVLIVTADHGKAEKMIDLNTGKISPGHTSNPVPIWLIGKDWRCRGQSRDTIYSISKSSVGVLSDVATTILDLLEISPAPEMEGASLIDVLKC